MSAHPTDPVPLSVLLAFVLLIAAAGVLAGEVWIGGRRRPRRAARHSVTAVFAGAAIAGTTLLTALSGREWLLALALLPLTTLSVIRFGTRVLPGAETWKRVVVVGVVLTLGVVGALQVVPAPLTRGHLSGSVETHPVDRPTIRPYAGRPVRG